MPVTVEIDPQVAADLAASKELEHVGGVQSRTRIGAGGSTPDFVTQASHQVNSAAQGSLGRLGATIAQAAHTQETNEINDDLGGRINQGVASVRFTSPLMQVIGPMFERYIVSRTAQYAKAAKPYNDAIAALQATRAQVADQSWFSNFIGDPLSLISSAVAAVATSGYSLGFDVAKRVQASQGSGQAATLAAIDAQIAAIVRARAPIVARYRTPLSLAAYNPADVPEGVTLVNGSTSTVGTAPVQGDLLKFIGGVLD